MQKYEIPSTRVVEPTVNASGSDAGLVPHASCASLPCETTTPRGKCHFRGRRSGAVLGQAATLAAATMTGMPRLTAWATA